MSADYCLSMYKNISIAVAMETTSLPCALKNDEYFAFLSAILVLHVCRERALLRNAVSPVLPGRATE